MKTLELILFTYSIIIIGNDILTSKESAMFFLMFGGCLGLGGFQCSDNIMYIDF